MMNNFLGFNEFLNESKLSGTLTMKGRAAMRKALRENILTFKFQKRDGTIRRAVGTLIPELLPKLKGTGRPKPPHQMVYYDLEKFAWRSFRSFKFIKILKTTPVSGSVIAEYERMRDKFMGKDDGTHDDTKDMEKADVKRAEHEEEHDTHDKHKEHAEKHGHEDHEHEDHEAHKHHDGKVYKPGEKIPEKELVRRSADFRKGSRKNDTTRKANDEFRKDEHED